jgi:hypothetical protein
MVLSDFRLFLTKSLHFFHKNDPDPHQKSPKTLNILQMRPKNHQNREGAVFESAGFDDFRVEFAKYFVFLGIFDGDRGRFDEKNGEILSKKVENRKSFMHGLQDVSKPASSQSLFSFIKQLLCNLLKTASMLD